MSFFPFWTKRRVGLSYVRVRYVFEEKIFETSSSEVEVMSMEHPHSTPPAFRLCEPNSAKFLRKGKLNFNNFIQITIFCWKISLKTLKASSVRVVVRLTQLLAVRTMHLSRAPSGCIVWQTASSVYWD